MGAAIAQNKLPDLCRFAEANMYPNYRELVLACFLVSLAHLGFSQSITPFPPSPTGGETVVVIFSEPFDCAAQPGALTTSSGNAFTFDSFTPNPNGAYNCPLVSYPPPTVTSFSENLGLLSPGKYVVTWNIYLVDGSGQQTLGSSTSTSFVVLPSVDAVTAISAGFTGNWFDPSQNGQGFSIEVLPRNQMLAEWLVFAPDGGQAWIVATGPITGNAAVLQGFQPVGSGGQFPPNFDASQLQNVSWGTILFSFTDCNNGFVSWQPTAGADYTSGSGYPSGSMPISRLTMPAGLSCP